MTSTRPADHAPTVETRPVRSLPDVWAETWRGMPWCDCGDNDSLTEAMVEWFAWSLYGDLPDRLTHTQVVATAAEVWQVEKVCRFFTLGVEDAVQYVNGTVAADYPVSVALAVVKAFSDRWNGCPEAVSRSACSPAPAVGRGS